MMLKISGLSKSFGGIKALDNCSLDIEQGKITAIIGPNGSGKSTLFNAVSSLILYEKGRIALDGKNITRLNDYQIAKSGISRTFQETRLFKNLTIKENILTAMSRNDESIFKSLFKKGRRSQGKRTREILALVNLKKPLSTYASDLSYGQKKLLDLAVAIAKPRKLLMLDEPVAGVNPHLRNEFKEIIRRLRKKGETIVIIEHDMNFVMDLAEHIIVLEAGKVIAEGTPKEIQNNKKVLEAYLGG